MFCHGELYTRLETFVTYLVSIYFAEFFLIKVKQWLLGCPMEVLHKLEPFLLQSPRGQELLITTLRRSAWHTHSESLPITMLCGDSIEEREFAVPLILKLPGEKTEGDLWPRTRKRQELQLNADKLELESKLENLIIWKAAKASVVTNRMNEAKLLHLVTSPPKLPYACFHTQEMERVVKKMTESSESVYRFNRSDGFVGGRA